MEKASSCPTTPMVIGIQFTAKGELIVNPTLYR